MRKSVMIIAAMLLTTIYTQAVTTSGGKTCPQAKTLGMKATTAPYEYKGSVCTDLKTSCCELASMNTQAQSWKLAVTNRNFYVWSQGSVPKALDAVLNNLDTNKAGCVKTMIRVLQAVKPATTVKVPLDWKTLGKGTACEAKVKNFVEVWNNMVGYSNSYMEELTKCNVALIEFGASLSCGSCDPKNDVAFVADPGTGTTTKNPEFVKVKKFELTNLVKSCVPYAYLEDKRMRPVYLSLLEWMTTVTGETADKAAITLDLNTKLAPTEWRTCATEKTILRYLQGVVDTGVDRVTLPKATQVTPKLTISVSDGCLTKWLPTLSDAILRQQYMNTPGAKQVWKLLRKSANALGGAAGDKIWSGFKGSKPQFDDGSGSSRALQGVPVNLMLVADDVKGVGLAEYTKNSFAVLDVQPGMGQKLPGSKYASLTSIGFAIYFLFVTIN